MGKMFWIAPFSLNDLQQNSYIVSGSQAENTERFYVSWAMHRLTSQAWALQVSVYFIFMQREGGNLARWHTHPTYAHTSTYAWCKITKWDLAITNACLVVCGSFRKGHRSLWDLQKEQGFSLWLQKELWKSESLQLKCREGLRLTLNVGVPSSHHS